MLYCSIKRGSISLPHKAPGLRFERRFTAPKAAVLPLDDPGALCGISRLRKCIITETIIAENVRQPAEDEEVEDFV